MPSATMHAQIPRDGGTHRISYYLISREGSVSLDTCYEEDAEDPLLLRQALWCAVFAAALPQFPVADISPSGRALAVH